MQNGQPVGEGLGLLRVAEAGQTYAIDYDRKQFRAGGDAVPSFLDRFSGALRKAAGKSGTQVVNGLNCLVIPIHGKDQRTIGTALIAVDYALVVKMEFSTQGGKAVISQELSNIQTGVQPDAGAFAIPQGFVQSQTVPCSKCASH